MKKTGLLGQFKDLSTEPDDNNVSDATWIENTMYIPQTAGEYGAQPEDTPIQIHHSRHPGEVL